jgi:hypothetical protein
VKSPAELGSAMSELLRARPQHARLAKHRPTAPAVAKPPVPRRASKASKPASPVAAKRKSRSQVARTGKQPTGKRVRGRQAAGKKGGGRRGAGTAQRRKTAKRAMKRAAAGKRR